MIRGERTNKEHDFIFNNAPIQRSTNLKLFLKLLNSALKLPFQSVTSNEAPIYVKQLVSFHITVEPLNESNL